MKILLINGPNLNLLGKREPETYGYSTLDEVVKRVKTHGKEMGSEVEAFQSNHEGELIDAIHKADKDEVDFIIINPGGFGHTSIALRDAFMAVDIPFIEVHMSNIYSREEFRHKTLLSDIADGTIAGFGEMSYGLAMMALATYAIEDMMDPEQDESVH